MKSIIDNNAGLKQELDKIAEVAGYLWQRGWAERNGGNISVNVTEYITDEYKNAPALQTGIKLPRKVEGLANNFFYVTGTGKRMRYVAKDPLANGAILRVSADGETYDIIADEVIMPTSELPSHFTIHNHMRTVLKKDTKVVCHTHPTDLIALTHNKELLDSKKISYLLWSMIPETRAFCPNGLGIIPYRMPGGLDLADESIKLLDRFDVVMWEKHGIVAVGDEMIETFDMIDTLSKAAQIYFYAKQAGFEPEGVPNEDMDAMAEVFNLPNHFKK